MNLQRFYVKIETEFYCYKIQTVSSETISLICAEHKNSKHSKKDARKAGGCNAKAKIKVDPALILVGTATRTDGRKRSIFKINYTDPRCIDLKSYKIIPHESSEHNFNCKKTFFDPLHVEFRHNHVQTGLALKAPAWTQTVQHFRLRERYGADFESKIIGDKKREHNVFYEKFSRIFEKCKKTEVPFEYRQIERTNFDDLSVFRENWHQHKSEKLEIFFLADELHYLETESVYADGTFYLMKDLDFCQVYILSVLFKRENRTYSYPIVCAFTLGRTSAIYLEFFSFIADFFQTRFKRPLKIPRIISDAESAILRPLRQVFPDISVKLCKVHVLRSWRRKMIEIFGQIPFLQDKNLKNFWLLLRGCFFIPAIFLEKITDFFIHEIRPLLKNSKTKFDDFLAYLKKNYVLPSAKFPPSMWSYHAQVSDFSDMETSTNSIERINLKLKRACPTGQISFHRACKILFEFKVEFLSQLTHKFDNFQFNLKRPKQIENETCVKNIVQEFTDLPLQCQSDTETLVNFCKKFALYNDDFSEESENVSDSINYHENSEHFVPSFLAQLYLSTDCE